LLGMFRAGLPQVLKVCPGSARLPVALEGRMLAQVGKPPSLPSGKLLGSRANTAAAPILNLVLDD
ncbi:hypothetical protein ACTJJM_19065, partial [Stenotrophomonas sp. 22692]|uniref:hypothetical protein n=1 Tax=Stenotrophomonas TaxID=40323 RepID=UPI0039C5DF29